MEFGCYLGSCADRGRLRSFCQSSFQFLVHLCSREEKYKAKLTIDAVVQRYSEGLLPSLGGHFHS